MADSKVYWMDAHSESTETSLVAKMETVFNAAKLDEMISPNDVVAIKIHCGEWNNSAYLRPVYARALADRIKELGGRPFVCDTTTSTYSPYGSRSSQLDILLTAERNGYSSATLGCPFVCADGWLGTGDLRVDIPEGYLLKEAYVAEAIAAADVLIALTHFKGHSMGVIGGAMKNLGIGAQSKRGKLNVHMGGTPQLRTRSRRRLPSRSLQGQGQHPRLGDSRRLLPLQPLEHQRERRTRMGARQVPPPAWAASASWAAGASLRYRPSTSTPWTSP